MKKIVLPNIDIHEMRKRCNVIWGWQAEGWDDKKVKQMYTLYKQGYFNLR